MSKPVRIVLAIAVVTIFAIVNGGKPSGERGELTDAQRLQIAIDCEQDPESFVCR